MKGGLTLCLCCLLHVPLRLQWLEIKETDDEKTKVRKRKLIKSYKSKMRFQEMDLTQKSKADSWQNFMTGKGSKKKTGFFTGKRCFFGCAGKGSRSSRIC